MGWKRDDIFDYFDEFDDDWIDLSNMNNNESLILLTVFSLCIVFMILLLFLGCCHGYLLNRLSCCCCVREDNFRFFDLFYFTIYELEFISDVCMLLLFHFKDYSTLFYVSLIFLLLSYLLSSLLFVRVVNVLFRKSYVKDSYPYKRSFICLSLFFFGHGGLNSFPLFNSNVFGLRVLSLNLLRLDALLLYCLKFCSGSVLFESVAFIVFKVVFLFNEEQWSLLTLAALAIQVFSILLQSYFFYARHRILAIKARHLYKKSVMFSLEIETKHSASLSNIQKNSQINDKMSKNGSKTSKNTKKGGKMNLLSYEKHYGLTRKLSANLTKLLSLDLPPKSAPKALKNRKNSKKRSQKRDGSKSPRYDCTWLEVLHPNIKKLNENNVFIIKFVVFASTDKAMSIAEHQMTEYVHSGAVSKCLQTSFDMDFNSSNPIDVIEMNSFVLKHFDFFTGRPLESTSASPRGGRRDGSGLATKMSPFKSIDINFGDENENEHEHEFDAQDDTELMRINSKKTGAEGGEGGEVALESPEIGKNGIGSKNEEIMGFVQSPNFGRTSSGKEVKNKDKSSKDKNKRESSKEFVVVYDAVAMDAMDGMDDLDEEEEVNGVDRPELRLNKSKKSVYEMEQSELQSSGRSGRSWKHLQDTSVTGTVSAVTTATVTATRSGRNERIQAESRQETKKETSPGAPVLFSKYDPSIDTTVDTGDTGGTGGGDTAQSGQSGQSGEIMDSSESKIKRSRRRGHGHVRTNTNEKIATKDLEFVKGGLHGLSGLEDDDENESASGSDESQVNDMTAEERRYRMVAGYKQHYDTPKGDATTYWKQQSQQQQQQQNDIDGDLNDDEVHEVNGKDRRGMSIHSIQTVASFGAVPSLPGTNDARNLNGSNGLNELNGLRQDSRDSRESKESDNNNINNNNNKNGSFPMGARPSKKLRSSVETSPAAVAPAAAPNGPLVPPPVPADAVSRGGNGMDAVDTQLDARDARDGVRHESVSFKNIKKFENFNNNNNSKNKSKNIPPVPNKKPLVFRRPLPSLPTVVDGPDNSKMSSSKGSLKSSSKRSKSKSKSKSNISDKESVSNVSNYDNSNDTSVLSPEAPIDSLTSLTQSDRSLYKRPPPPPKMIKFPPKVGINNNNSNRK